MNVGSCCGPAAPGTKSCLLMFFSFIYGPVSGEAPERNAGRRGVVPIPRTTADGRGCPVSSRGQLAPQPMIRAA